MTKAERLKMIANELSRDLEHFTDVKDVEMLVIMAMQRLESVINKADHNTIDKTRLN